MVGLKPLRTLAPQHEYCRNGSGGMFARCLVVFKFQNRIALLTVFN